MTDVLDVIDVALRVADALVSVGARYFVGGSVASSVDGEPRATNDIDFVIDLPLGRVAALAAALGPDFEVDEAMLREAILRGGCANIFFLPEVIKIDFFGHAREPFDEIEFERSREVEVRPGKRLFIKSAEDTILRKLVWYRSGGEVSDRQWRDVLGVLRERAEQLDNVHLERWATHLHVADLLRRARAEALA